MVARMPWVFATIIVLPESRVRAGRASHRDAIVAFDLKFLTMNKAAFTWANFLQLRVKISLAERLLTRGETR